jgi:hypothetical protein
MNEDLFPQPLYETTIDANNKVCLICGKDKAIGVLRTIQKPIIPICKECIINWNWYGYNILKKINPKTLMQNIIKYKVMHWFKIQSIIRCYYDLRDFQIWSKRQKKFLKTSNR